MQHYVMSDIHGNLAAFEGMMNLIEKKNGSNYHLFFLGDAADRGNYGYEIMKSLLANPNVTYFKGNHEDLFIEAAKDYHGISSQKHNYESPLSLHLYNGGIPTIEAWEKDGADMKIIYHLESLPLKTSYKNYDMCHAGCMKEVWDNDSINEFDLLWNRGHLPADWRPNHILIHGHTPVRYICKKFGFSTEDILQYNNKIAIDLETAYTNELAAINLDEGTYLIYEATNNMYKEEKLKL